MEIFVLKGSTKIGASPNKFDFSNIEDEITPLSDVESKGVYICTCEGEESGRGE